MPIRIRGLYLPMGKNKGKKGKKRMSTPEDHENATLPEPHINTTDDDYRDEVEPAPERPDDDSHEDWARPGDEDKPPEELPKATDMPKYGEE